MSKKLLSLCVALSSAVIAHGVEFSGFNLSNYISQDLRVAAYKYPFPIVFHYLAGGQSSISPEYRILMNDNPETAPDVLPPSITTELQNKNVQNIQYFEAYCKAENQNCNYFTHLWSMDKMVENRITEISSGMYDPHNLTPVQGQIGVNNLVKQSMSFHDREYLSGNVAKFRIGNMNQVADAWFLSIYDPDYNRYNPNDPNNTYNANVNQTKKAIVVHWYIIPGNVIQTEQHLQEVLSDWDRGNVYETLTPQFIPQQ